MDKNQYIDRLGGTLDAREVPVECTPNRLVFETKQKLLYSSALEGTSKIYFDLEKARKLHFISLCQDESLREIFSVLEYLTTDFRDLECRPLGPMDLDNHKGKNVAILKIPQFFKSEIGAQTTSLVLSDLFFGSDVFELISQILNDSVFSSKEVSFATHYRGIGRPYILGADTNRFRSLLGISHELGHCVWDRTYYRKDTCLMRSLSEAYAHILEEEIVSYCLAQRNMTKELSRWKTYQRMIDSMNQYFFELEYFEDLLGRSQNDPLISMPMRVFRSSYFIVPGLQTTYLMATYIRRCWRDKMLSLHPARIVRLMTEPDTFLKVTGVGQLSQFL